MSDSAGIIATCVKINRQWDQVSPPGNTFTLKKRLQNSKKGLGTMNIKQHLIIKSEMRILSAIVWTVRGTKG